jgi:hypothetical protein
MWWRTFASPKMLLLAAPAMVLPLVIVILSNNPTAPSPVEEAIQQLPVAGGPSTTASPNGNGRAGLPESVSVKLYADSARPDATPQSIAIVDETKTDIDSAQYAVLHPLSMAREDLMIGQLALVFTSPLDAELSGRIFQEFCNAKPGDPFYNVSLNDLPIDGPLRDALVRWSSGSSSASVCPRLQG